jgi:hypothetical protein
MRHRLVPSAAIFVLACTKVDSSSIKTSGMSAHIHVAADGTGQTTASASLNVDDSLTDYVDLSTGDSFVTTVNGTSQTMSRSNVLNVITYLATFTGKDAENTAYTVAFRRTSDTSAPNSTCTVPRPFSIQGPASGASLSRTNDDIVVRYDSVPTTDALTYDVQGDCVATSLGHAVAGGDSGSFTIPKGTLVSSDPSQAGVTCRVTITLHRSRNGQLDPAYGYGGSIWAEQVRSVAVSSAP